MKKRIQADSTDSIPTNTIPTQMAGHWVGRPTGRPNELTLRAGIVVTWLVLASLSDDASSSRYRQIVLTWYQQIQYLHRWHINNGAHINNSSNNLDFHLSNTSYILEEHLSNTSNILEKHSSNYTYILRYDVNKWINEEKNTGR